MESVKHKWLTISPDTFIWTKGILGLIYNSKKQNGFHFTLNNRIKQIINELLLPENLYSTLLTCNDLKENEVGRWVYNIINEMEGGFLTSAKKKRPVSFMPILKLEKNIEFYVLNHQRGTGGETLYNIHELNFFFNKSETGNDSYFKQANFPLKTCSELDIKNILNFVQDSINPYLMNINLIGNIFSYPSYQYLIESILDFGVRCTINVTLQDFLENLEKVRFKRFSIHLHFNILMDKSSFIDSFQNLRTVKEKISLTALVLSMEDHNFFSGKFKNELSDYSTQIIPVFDENNLLFFENNVFMNQEDLENIKLTKREIFLNQTINNNDFGKFTILTDGSVYGNVNLEKLGTVENSPYSIVFKELTQGHAWRRIRDLKPCKDCLYQWLCPSPSNYELVLGKSNLCHIKP